VIQATEENPPLGVAPLGWLLLTTLPITGIEDVVQGRALVHLPLVN